MGHTATPEYSQSIFNVYLRLVTKFDTGDTEHFMRPKVKDRVKITLRYDGRACLGNKDLTAFLSLPFAELEIRYH